MAWNWTDHRSSESKAGPAISDRPDLGLSASTTRSSEKQQFHFAAPSTQTEVRDQAGGVALAPLLHSALLAPD